MGTGPGLHPSERGEADMKGALCKLSCRMEGEELSHGRGTYTEKSTLHHRLDSYRSALTLSIRDKQGASLTVAPAEAKEKESAATVGADGKG